MAAESDPAAAKSPNKAVVILSGKVSKSIKIFPGVQGHLARPEIVFAIV